MERSSKPRFSKECGVLYLILNPSYMLIDREQKRQEIQNCKYKARKESLFHIDELR